MNSADVSLEPFYKALITGNTMECRRIASDLWLSKKDLSIVYEHLFKPCLYKIGEEWERHRISVAVEHMATSIIESLMNEIFADSISLERKHHKVVLASVQNEEHQVGSRMIADTFEQFGWDSFFLGANTPVNDLVDFIKDVQPDLVCLSLSVYFNVDVLLHEIEEIKKSSEIPVLIGGQALQKAGPQIASKFDNVFYLKDIFEVKKYIKGIE